MIFKAITGDCDIVPANFVVDKTTNMVIPIDGESAFPGTSHSADVGSHEFADAEASYGTWSKEQLVQFLNDPGEYIDDMFNGDAGFLSQDINTDDVAIEFLNQLNTVWDNDTFALLKQALRKTTTDLSNINNNQDKTTLVGQDPVSESQVKLTNIETMAKNYVNQLYGFLEEYAYEKSQNA